MASASQLGNIAGVKPAVANNLVGRRFVFPVAGEHAGAAHQDFAVDPKPDFLWIKRKTGITGFREWTALAQHQRVLCDAVEVTQIYAPDLP